jgi:hypothetical protein
MIYFYMLLKFILLILYNCFYDSTCCAKVRGDQIGLFKLVTLNCILNRITGVTFGC